MNNDKQLYRSNATDSGFLHNSITLFLKEIYDIMKECYGPYGSHIIIDNEIRPEATKDGKTILSRIRTDGTISASVHGSILSVANKQVDEVGDGSTTTILLLCKLYTKFMNIIKEYNVSPSVLNKNIKEVVSNILMGLKDISEKIVYTKIDDGADIKNILIDFDTLYKAVHTSVDGDSDLATKIIDMFKELNSVEPLILVELSPNESHRYELVKGIESNGTVIRPDIYFNGLSRMEYNDPRIVVINGRFDMSLDHYMTYAQQSLREDRDTIFLATGIKEDTLNGLVSMNSTSPGYFARVPVFQIRNSALDEEFLDLCASIGAKPIDSGSLSRVSSIEAINNLIRTSAGLCSKALLTEFCARFSNPIADENAVKLRVDEINEKIEALNNDPTSYNDRITDLENRRAFLTRHYAKFFVGGYSPQRKAINYELANDGIPQAISCMKHGIVQGCNVVVPMIIDKIIKSQSITDLELKIIEAIRDSYVELMIQLVSNKVGYDDAVEYVKDNNRSKGKSFNIRPDDNTDVINSADTDRAILQNATDMASLLATARAFISRQPEFDVVKRGYND